MLNRRFKEKDYVDKSPVSDIQLDKTGSDFQNTVAFNQGVQKLDHQPSQIEQAQNPYNFKYTQSNIVQVPDKSYVNPYIQDQNLQTEQDQLNNTQNQKTDASFLNNQTNNDFMNKDKFQDNFQDVQPKKPQMKPLQIEQIKQTQNSKFNTNRSDKKTNRKKELKEKLKKQGNKKNVLGLLKRFLLDDDLQSHIFPRNIKNPPKQIFFDTILPFIFVLMLHSLIYAIQQEVGDFCYIDEPDQLECECENSNIQFWSFIRQLVLFKLSHLSYKRIIMKSLVKQSPYIESFLFYFFTIGIDFIMVHSIEINNDIVFLVVVFILGILIPSHILKFSNFFKAFWEARGLLLYDATYVLCFIYIYYAIPKIYEEVCDYNGEQDGKLIFIYIYPILEIILELILDISLSFANKAEFFLYQVQQILLGLRVGILIAVDHKNFEFWYLIVFFALKRLNSQTQVLNIMIRKVIQQCMSQKNASKLKLSQIYKGKNGQYMENVFLFLFMFYLLWGIETLMPYKIHDLIVVQDCQFNTYPKFGKIPWYRPMIIWACLLFGEATGIFLNQETQLDTIKWVGAKQCTLFDNVVIRMTGWYFFQMAMIFPMVKLNYEGKPLFFDLIQK